jgi:pimeloyl-ACP methyl ester carboxylesterase
LRVLDSLQVDHFSLAGHSFGGKTTLTVALKAAGRIDRMMLVNVAMGFAEEPRKRPEGPDSLTRFIFEHSELRETLAAIGTHPMMTRRFVSKFVRSPECLTPPVLKMYQAPLSVRDKSAMMGAWLADFFLNPDFALIEDLSAYQAIVAPVRIVWGELDPVTPLWQAREIQGWFKDAALATIPGVSHIPMIEDSEAFYKELDRVFP